MSLLKRKRYLSVVILLQKHSGWRCLQNVHWYIMQFVFCYFLKYFFYLQVLVAINFVQRLSPHYYFHLYRGCTYKHTFFYLKVSHTHNTQTRSNNQWITRDATYTGNKSIITQRKNLNVPHHFNSSFNHPVCFIVSNNKYHNTTPYFSHHSNIKKICFISKHFSCNFFTPSRCSGAVNFSPLNTISKRWAKQSQ